MGGEGTYERGDRGGAIHRGRDGEVAHEAHTPIAGREESSPRRDDRLSERTAYDHLAEREVVPFGLVPVEVRERAERMTGRSLEESYEGFTSLMESAIRLWLMRGPTRPAKERRDR